MNVFGVSFLEPMRPDGCSQALNWSWTPHNTQNMRIYASGNSTNSRSSTYAAEKDSREDQDRPNEGLAA